jgi:hypothetical protein
MKYEIIRQSDLKKLLAMHNAQPAFATALQRIEDNDQLLRALGRYIHFNSIFGSGVANLAGEMAARQDLFRDPVENCAVLADRSVELAADIFSAAVDEFGIGSHSRRSTHRTLAQATLKASGVFLGFDSQHLDRVVNLNDATLMAIGLVREGYGLNRTLDEGDLFRAVGFHIGSELLADEEFRLLDGFLREKHPELVRSLESRQVRLNGASHPAYLWIHIHTSVEADHAASALAGANQALRFYAGAARPAQIKEWILEGFVRFISVQREFMAGLI